MTQQIINVGSAPSDGTGDPDRIAFTKCNDNFTELYARGGGGVGGPPQGRLTLQTATPVMTTTRSAQTSIYYSPYVGDQIPLNSGSVMAMTTFTELSVATTDTTKNPAAIGASKVNDWFVWDDAGTLRLSHGPDWASDTTRVLLMARLNGIWVNNVAITNGPASQRGTYVGTTRSNASSQLDWIYGAAGTAGFFGVWNAYNRVMVASVSSDTTTSWAYGSNIWRATNANAQQRCTFVDGLGEGVVTAIYNAIGVSGAASAVAAIGVGLDSTAAPYANSVTSIIQLTGLNAGITASLATGVGVGVHFVNALEFNQTSNASTWFGAPLASLGFKTGFSTCFVA